jgi:hypothetical protein
MQISYETFMDLLNRQNLCEPVRLTLMEILQKSTIESVPAGILVKKGAVPPVQTAGLNQICEYIANELDDDSRVGINIEPNYGSITLYNSVEKIGDYDASESLPTMEHLLEYVLGREKHLHKG